MRIRGASTTYDIYTRPICVSFHAVKRARVATDRCYLFLAEVKEKISVRILESHQSRKALAAHLDFGTVSGITAESITTLTERQASCDPFEWSVVCRLFGCGSCAHQGGRPVFFLS